MSREVGGGRRGAARGIQDTAQATREACGGDLRKHVSEATWINWGTYGA